MRKTLIILRHAKAQAGEDDHARGLAERGERDAAAMGAWLVKQGMVPDKILCSTAERTRRTLEHLGLPDVAAGFFDALYNASENQILQVIGQTPDEVGSLMVIGHNPGLHQIALRLSREADHEVKRQLMLEFPTCALAVINLQIDAWQHIGSSKGRLRQFMVPQKL